MPKNERSYELISPEDAISDPQAKRLFSELDQKWDDKTRNLTASGLALGLLVLFGLIVICGGVTVSALVITDIILHEPSSDQTSGTQQVIDFIGLLLPYIATPLGVALGYYFRGAQGE
jgi:hypothetical protein